MSRNMPLDGVHRPCSYESVTLPRILLVVPGLLAGLLIPALSHSPKAPPPGAVGMRSTDFAQSVVTIHRGERLTLVNDSHLVHVVGPGRGGHIISPAAGVPVLGWHLMQTNGVYETPPWRVPGTYHLTCSVHPDMTLKVVVTR
jgi:plastocyanin